MNIESICKITFKYYSLNYFEEKEIVLSNDEFTNLKIDNLKRNYSEKNSFDCTSLSFNLSSTFSLKKLEELKNTYNLDKVLLSDNNNTYMINLPFYDTPHALIYENNLPFKIYPVFIEGNRKIKVTYEKRNTIGMFFYVDNTFLFKNTSLDNGQSCKNYIYYKDTIESVWYEYYSTTFGLLNNNITRGIILYDIFKNKYLVFTNIEIHLLDEVFNALKGTDYEIKSFDQYREYLNIVEIYKIGLIFENCDIYELTNDYFKNLILGDIVCHSNEVFFSLEKKYDYEYDIDLLSFKIDPLGLKQCNTGIRNHCSLYDRLNMNNDICRVELVYSNGNTYDINVPSTFSDYSSTKVNFDIGLEEFLDKSIRVTIFKRNNICIFYLIDGKIKTFIPDDTQIIEYNKIFYCDMNIDDTYNKYPKGRVEYDISTNTFIIYKDARIDDVSFITKKMIGQKYKIVNL